VKGAHLEPALVFMRSRTIGRVAIPIVLVLSFQIAIADQLIELPFGGERAAARISPVMGALWSTIIGSLVLRRSPELEWFTSPRLRDLRLSWGTILVGGTAVGVEAVSQIRTLDAFGLQVRNGLLFAGFALLTAVAVGARFVWVPQVLAAGALFGFGTDPYDGTPLRWALVYLPPSVAWTWVVSVIVALAGVVLYTLRDARPARGLPG
jgi:hypothetical protein